VTAWLRQHRQALSTELLRLGVLNRLVEAGNTVIVIEHNLDVIKTADWVIDLGPEGGDSGGRVVAVGTPEQVARNAQSHTGRFLARVLDSRNGAKQLSFESVGVAPQPPAVAAESIVETAPPVADAGAPPVESPEPD